MIVDRNDFIINKCRGKSVFDVACVCHNLADDQIKKGLWLHHNIKQVAHTIKGIDIEREEIEKLNDKGYNIYYCDAEQINEENKYDVVVLGSCIEHFFNPGLVLDAIKGICHEETIIIISTVNAWAIRYFISAMINNEARSCRADHVAWYSHYVLENLLRLKGFEISEKHYYNFHPAKINGIRPLLRNLQKRIMPFTSHGIIVVFKPQSIVR